LDVKNYSHVEYDTLHVIGSIWS